MRIFLNSRSLGPADIARAAVTGVVAGTVSAGWRWAIFRYEGKRRTKRMHAELSKAAEQFSSVVEQAQKGLERMAATRKGGEPTLSVDVTGPFRVSGDDLDKIFADLNQHRQDRDGA